MASVLCCYGDGGVGIDISVGDGEVDIRLPGMMRSEGVTTCGIICMHVNMSWCKYRHTCIPQAIYIMVTGLHNPCNVKSCPDDQECTVVYHPGFMDIPVAHCVPTNTQTPTQKGSHE